MKVIWETKVFLPGERRAVLAFTDLHFSKYFGKERLEILLEKLREAMQREEVGYVCFLGDLVDSLAAMDEAELRQELCGFLRGISEKVPVIMVFGNHDWSRYEGKRSLIDERGFEGLRQMVAEIPGVQVLSGKNEVFDDGKVRMLGVDLPKECYYFTNLRSSRSAQEAFREKMAESLPKLKAVADREYYLLLHSSRFLREIELDRDVVVLSGHMHDGAVPPVLDKLTRFSGRGLIGPGFIKKNGRRLQYEILPWNARLRPREGRIWLSLRPVNYLPRDRRIGKLNRLFSEMSYTVIKGGAKKVRVEEKFLEM